MRTYLRRLLLVLVTIVVVLSGISPFGRVATALELTNKNVVIDNSNVSAVTTQVFSFDIQSTAGVGSIKFEYCANGPLYGTPCTPPTGLDVSGANFVSEYGETGFSIYTPTSVNTIVLTRPVAPTIASTVSYTLNNLVNPSTPNQTVYVRISTHPDTDASAPPVDRGAVAFSTAENLVVGAYVPPYITFCVAISVSNDCSTADGNFIDLGILSASTTKASTSQFAVSTNDPTGYVVSVHGTTMTSGNNVIPAIPSPSPSTRGASQYGINLRANSQPAVGNDPSGVGTGVVEPNYSIPNRFYFVPNTLIASSSLPTDFTVFTASYVVNVSGGQPSGIYSTTSSYTATAAF